jgi:prefoldin subunit 5
MTSSSSISDVQGRIQEANRLAEDSRGALNEARKNIDEARTMLQQAMSGSSQNDADEAIRLYSDAVEKLDDVQDAVAQAVQQASEVSSRL